MAEGDGYWWGSWLQAAKEKSANVLEFMKKDLDEFSTTVQNETVSMVSNTAAVLKEKLKFDDSESTANKVKRSVSGFLGSVSQALTPTQEENDDEVCIIRNSEPVVLDRLQAQIFSVQSNPHTYRQKPEGPIEEYEEWIQNFDLEEKQQEILDLMVNNADVRKLYTNLVPPVVSHIEFWQHYFYKIHQLEKAELRKQKLVERAASDIPAEELSWDDDEDFGAAHEISSDLADQLLADYQKECEEREKNISSKTTNISQSKIEEAQDIVTSQESDDSVVLKLQNSVLKETQALPSDSTDCEETLVQTENNRTDNTANSNKVSNDIDCPNGETTQSLISPNSPTVDVNNQTHVSTSAESQKENQQKNFNNSTPVEKQYVAHERGDLVVIKSSLSDRTSPASSNKEGSNDDEWEKDFDLEANEDDLTLQETTKPVISSTQRSTSNQPEEEEEDWENWE